MSNLPKHASRFKGFLVDLSQINMILGSNMVGDFAKEEQLYFSGNYKTSTIWEEMKKFEILSEEWWKSSSIDML